MVVLIYETLHYGMNYLLIDCSTQYGSDDERVILQAVRCGLHPVGKGHHKSKGSSVKYEVQKYA